LGMTASRPSPFARRRPWLGHVTAYRSRGDVPPRTPSRRFVGRRAPRAATNGVPHAGVYQIHRLTSFRVVVGRASLDLPEGFFGIEQP
jgi:hypothetical protein